MISQKKMAVTLEYGLGKSCAAEFDESTLQGVPAHELITMVVDSPQETKPAQRTARMVSSAIRTRRPLDVEVVRGNQQNGEPGDPVELDDPIINREENSPGTEALTVRVSEPYIGG